MLLLDFYKVNMEAFKKVKSIMKEFYNCIHKDIEKTEKICHSPRS